MVYHMFADVLCLPQFQSQLPIDFQSISPRPDPGGKEGGTKKGIWRMNEPSILNAMLM